MTYFVSLDMRQRKVYIVGVGGKMSDKINVFKAC